MPHFFCVLNIVAAVRNLESAPLRNMSIETLTILSGEYRKWVEKNYSER
jgi:hypothetical protein